MKLADPTSFCRRFRYAGMLLSCNILRPAAVNLRHAGELTVVTVVLACMLVAGPSFGQAPKVTENDADTAFKQVEAWVRAGEVPAADKRVSMPLTGIIAVQVTLRDNGRYVGQGSAIREDINDCVDKPGPAFDLNALLAEATDAALEDALAYQKRRAVDQGLTQPDVFEQMVEGFHRRALVDVQIGHGLTSILLAPTSERDAIFGQFAPGFHGLRMIGPLMPNADMVWPGSALARNNSPLSQLRQLLTRQGYEQDEVPLIARQDGPQLQRFEVFHIVRASLNQPPRQLIRGNLLIRQQLIDGENLDRTVDRIAEHLDTRIVATDQPGERVVRGAYLPSYDRYQPELSEPRQVALMCYAMMLHCETVFRRSPNNDRIMRRAERIADVIRSYGPTAMPGRNKPNHLTTAFMLMAMNHGPVEVDPVLQKNLAEAILAMRHPEGGFRAAPEGDERLSRASAAVLTAALATHYIESNDKRFAEAAWAGLGELFEVNRDEALVVDLFWLSIAMDRAGDRLAQAADDPEQAAKTLADYRSILAEQMGLLVDQQIKAPPLLGPSDVIGGFVLTPGPAGSPPNPTWQSSMPLGIIALSLKDSRIVPADRVHGPILAAGLGARFINQLLLTRTNSYYVRNLARADGGVRNNLWDNTLYLDCSSMSLLGLTHFQAMLDELERRKSETDR